MVIFNSYVKLPEGTSKVAARWKGDASYQRGCNSEDNWLLGNTDARGNTKKIARQWLVPKSDVAHIPCVSIAVHFNHVSLSCGERAVWATGVDREEICGRILERAINDPPSTNHHQQVIYNPYHYYTHRLIDSYIHIYIYIYTYTHIHIYIYVYVHIYIYTW